MIFYDTGFLLWISVFILVEHDFRNDFALWITFRLPETNRVHDCGYFCCNRICLWIKWGKCTFSGCLKNPAQTPICVIMKANLLKKKDNHHDTQ